MGRKRVERQPPFDTPLVIIGVDPGKETGLAFYATRHGVAFKDSLPPDQVVIKVEQWLASQLTQGCVVIIGVERYQVGASTVKKTRQTDAVEIRGQLIELANRHKVILKQVNQADSKRLARDETLQRIGWWLKGHANRHINDALRIVLTTLAQSRPDEFASVIDL